MKKPKKTFPPKKIENTIFKTAPKHNWSDYQKDIFRDIARGTGNTMVIARARIALKPLQL